MHETDTKTLISALRILAKDVWSDDGVASATIKEGVERLEEYQERLDEIQKIVAIIPQIIAGEIQFSEH